MLGRHELVAEHFHTTGSPRGHGFTARNRADGTAYYAFDRGPVTFVVLDTVDPSGGARGSIDRTQLGWLRGRLHRARGRIVVLASHHSTRTMTSVGAAGSRVLGAEVLSVALEHPQVVAWFNGHEHRNQVWARTRPDGGGLWEVTSASHVDWPQQSRLVEIADNRDGTLSIFSTMLDHAGPVSYGGNLSDPVALAGLSRELSANDWQERTTGRRGRPQDRNLELLVRAPRPGP
jgi:metallophosphoesterase (TIGR03767 family)